MVMLQMAQHFILFPILRKKQSIKKFTGLNMDTAILNSVWNWGDTCQIPQRTQGKLQGDVNGIRLHFGFDKLQHFPHVARLGTKWGRLIRGNLKEKAKNINV